MKSVRAVSAWVFLTSVCVLSAGGDEVAPAVRPVAWAARVGQPVEVRLAGEATASIAAQDVRVIVRSRGAQELIEAQPAGESGLLVWRFGPRHEGTCVVASRIEPSSSTAGDRTFRYEKLFLRVAPEDPEARIVVRPSASATARFGHRLELAPLVDPAALLVGADLPVRVKFDGLNLQGAAVVVRCQPGRGAPSDAARQDGRDSSVDARKPAAPPRTLHLKTNKSASVNIPIREAGLWTITVEHRPAGDVPDGGGADRFVATMMFVVTQADMKNTGAGARPPRQSGKR